MTRSAAEHVVQVVVRVGLELDLRTVGRKEPMKSFLFSERKGSVLIQAVMPCFCRLSSDKLEEPSPYPMSTSWSRFADLLAARENRAEGKRLAGAHRLDIAPAAVFSASR